MPTTTQRRPCDAVASASPPNAVEVSVGIRYVAVIVSPSGTWTRPGKEAPPAQEQSTALRGESRPPWETLEAFPVPDGCGRPGSILPSSPSPRPRVTRQLETPASRGGGVWGSLRGRFRRGRPVSTGSFVVALRAGAPEKRSCYSCVGKLEPAVGLEPTTCRLRMDQRPFAPVSPGHTPSSFITLIPAADAGILQMGQCD